MRIFVEEAEFGYAVTPGLRIEAAGDVTAVVPQLAADMPSDASRVAVPQLLDELIHADRISDYSHQWHWRSPTTLTLTTAVYDCMDELAAFKEASAIPKQFEAELMDRADLVLTGGQSPYEAKRHQHRDIHPFSSTMDVGHFRNEFAHAEGDPTYKSSDTDQVVAQALTPSGTLTGGRGRATVITA